MKCERCLAELGYGEGIGITLNDKIVIVCSSCREDIRQINIKKYDKDKSKSAKKEG